MQFMTEIPPLFLHTANNTDPANENVKALNRSIISHLIRAIKEIVSIIERL